MIPLVIGVGVKYGVPAVAALVSLLAHRHAKAAHNLAQQALDFATKAKPTQKV